MPPARRAVQNAGARDWQIWRDDDPAGTPPTVDELPWAGTLRSVVSRLVAAAAGTVLVVGCSDRSDAPETTVDPAESPVVIDLTTTTGSILHVLGPERYDCSPDGGRIICLVRFPILEAQRSGRWTVTASKPDGPAAAVAVRVRSEAVDNP